MAQVRDAQDILTGWRDGCTAEQAGEADALRVLEPPKKPKRFLMRRWLNRRGKQTVAFVYADLNVSEEIFIDEDMVKTTRRYVSGDFIISDCTRQVTLQIEGDENTVEKLNHLIKAAEDARDWVIRASNWMSR